MRTDVANNNTSSAEICLKTDSFKGKFADELKVVKGVRRTLQPLQKTAGVDKENLVGAGRSPMPLKEKLSSAGPQLHDLPKPAKKLRAADPARVTAEDLTAPAEGELSARYWETLAERRRVSLEAALEENRRLAERVALLEEENSQANALLVESRQIIETLNEILNENVAEDEETADLETE